ncbi:hypothetical protein ACS0TY_030234 [Phlomoides rotata]
MSIYKLPHGQQLLVDAPETIEKTRSWDGHNITHQSKARSDGKYLFRAHTIYLRLSVCQRIVQWMLLYLFERIETNTKLRVSIITRLLDTFYQIRAARCHGDLPFFSITENEEGADSSKKAQQATSITFSSRRPAILVDGTYATQSAASETAFSSLVVVQGSLSAGMLSDKQLCEIKEIKVKAQIPQSQPDDLIDFYHLKSRKGMSQLELENEVQDDLKCCSAEAFLLQYWYEP